jgi:hypothetical protein
MRRAAVAENTMDCDEGVTPALAGALDWGDNFVRSFSLCRGSALEINLFNPATGSDAGSEKACSWLATMQGGNSG